MITYYIAQIKHKCHWIGIGISDESLEVVNKMLSDYLSMHGMKETRIIQRCVKDNLHFDKKKCC